MPESIAEDLITLFPQDTNIAYDVRPLTSIPLQPQPTPNLELTIPVPPKPLIHTKPRTTSSAPSSPTAPSPKPIPEEGNLIPRRRRSTKDDSQVIRRAPQIGEFSQARAKIALRTSGADEFNYLPKNVLEENRRAFEELERRKVQDDLDLRAAFRIAREEADEAEADVANPLLCQISEMKKIERSKDEDIEWCSKKTKLRRYKSTIVDASIRGERGSKRKPAKAIITITRADETSTTHTHTQLETFGYYEWLEIREVIQKEKSTYKKYVEDELNRLLTRMSKRIKVPPLQPRPKRRSSAEEGPRIRNETGVKFSAEEILFSKWKVDLRMLNTRLPACRPMPSGTIIMEPEHGVYFEDGFGELQFQRAKEISKAPTQHLTNLLTIIENDPNQILPFMFNKIIRHELDERHKKGEFVDIPPP